MRRRLLILTLSGLAGACAAPIDAPDPEPLRVTRGLDRTDRFLADRGMDERRRAEIEADRPPAMVGGQEIGWDALTPRLAEAAGPEVLEEIVLERLLAGECRRRGVEIAPDDLDAERRRLIETLGASGVTPDDEQSERLLMDVRRRRGLGPLRFESLLRRTAMLRALVRDEVVISDSDIERAHAVRYGPAHPARLIVVPTARRADEVVRRVRAGEPFGEVAAEMSTDVSAARGGRIEPVNPADLSWPEPVRAMIGRLRPGEVGDPVLIEQGYAVLMREPAEPEGRDAPEISEVRDLLERDARLQRERILMTRLARRLLDDADLTVFEPSLRAR